MKELEAQKYLRSGKTPEELKEELGIKFGLYEDMIILNYSQINSVKSNTIVQECRSLILEQDTWDLVSMAFRRFFNKGEMLEITDSFNFNGAVAQEKIDGSIISLFHRHDRWYMSTRSSIEGRGQVMFNDITFKSLFERTLRDTKYYDRFNKEYIYIFELVSLDNKVVRVYEEDTLYLLGMRDASSFEESEYREIQSEYGRLNIPTVKLPKLYNFDNIEELLQMHKDMEATEEGFVVVNYNKREQGNFARLKVKNPAHVAIAHMKDHGGASMRCILQLIILGEEQEFLSYFPEFMPLFNPLKKVYDEYLLRINNDTLYIQEDLNNKLGRKEYAMIVKSMTCPALMFEMYDGRASSFRDYVDNYTALKGLKIFAKNLLKILKFKDKELSTSQEG